MRHHGIQLVAVASGLLCLSEAAVSQEVFLDFKTFGTQVTSKLELEDVAITADDGAVPAQVQMLNFNGLGVVGGSADSTTDGSEALHFDLGGYAFHAAYHVGLANNLDLDGFVGECTLEAFDGATSLGVIPVNDIGWKNVPAMFGGVAITSFTVRADVDGNRIDAMSYELVWKDLGKGLAGTNGVPVLTGDGPLTPGSSTSLSLSDGLPAAPTWIILGFSELSVPFMGGVLVPSPDRIVGPFFLDGNGELAVSATWPAGVPAGTKAWWQTWTMDVGSIGGFAGSNALRSTTY
jgi:hypothetical protein